MPQYKLQVWVPKKRGAKDQILVVALDSEGQELNSINRHEVSRDDATMVAEKLVEAKTAYRACAAFMKEYDR